MDRSQSDVYKRQLGKIAAHGGVLGVHSIAGGYKSYHSAGTHLVLSLIHI